MRELQICPPTKEKPPQVVRRLAFVPNGAELVAWVGSERHTADGSSGFTNRLHKYDLAADSARECEGGQWFGDYDPEHFQRTPDPVISPDGVYLVLEANARCLAGEGGIVMFAKLDEPTNALRLPDLTTDCEYGLGSMTVTPNGKELIAVRNLTEDGIEDGEPVPDVVRFEMASLLKPPVRIEERTNPLSMKSYQIPIYNVRWRAGMTLPRGERIATAAVSADGRLLAVGGSAGAVHVADLKRKKVLASFPWQGRKTVERWAVRVAFDPEVKRVVMLANGRLFTRPIGDGKPWQTAQKLGYVHDFAFHPNGRIICAVFADGEARYLDPLTGKVRQAFKWAKKPEPLYSVAFAPDGLTCAAGSGNGKVILWDVDA
jgi:hypothetical protein